MHESRTAVLRYFEEQLGLITIHQARHCGMSQSTVNRRVAGGEWVRVSRGVFRHAAVRLSWHSAVLGHCLYTRGVASHRTAAALWNLDGFRPRTPELVVPRNQATSTAGVILHRSTQFDLIHPVLRHAIPTTPIERTLIDLGRVVRWARFEAAIDDALRRELTDWPALLTTYRTLGRRGRNGSGALRRILDERFGDDRIPLSAWSRWVASQLTDAGLPHPVFEHRVLDADGTFLAQVDLAYPDEKVAIELQSVKHHLDRASFERDAVRAANLAAVGWIWIPVTWRRHREESAQLVQTIRAARSRSANRPAGNHPLVASRPISRG